MCPKLVTTPSFACRPWEGYEIDAAKLREEARLKCAEAGTSGDLTPELLEDLDRLISAQQNHERYASSGTPRDTQDDEAEEFSNDSFREDEAEALDYAIDEWRRHGASMGLLTSAVPVSHLTDEHVAVLALQWLKTTASRASGLLGIIAEALMQPTGAAVAPAAGVVGTMEIEYRTYATKSCSMLFYFDRHEHFCQSVSMSFCQDSKRH